MGQGLQSQIHGEHEGLSAAEPAIITSGAPASLSAASPDQPARRVAVVVDTNVALDWLVFDDPATRGLRDWVESGAWNWVATASMRIELADVLGRPAFRQHDAAAVLARWDAWAQLHNEPVRGPLVCADPDDQVFIDLALAHPANWLLTRDKELLKLGRAAQDFHLSICEPRALLE